LPTFQLCPGGPDRLAADGTEAIRALSFADVDEIIGLFDRVHPYDLEVVSGSLLEIEAENYGTGGE